MRTKLIPACVLLTIGLAISFGFNSIVRKKTVQLAGDSFALVELFTSEGCSSCPAAEEEIARLQSENKKNVYILSFHVDYWNRLGWTDAFSKPEYSQRQSKYADIFGLSSIYTPQVVINGSSEFVGSDRQKLASAVDNSLQMKVTPMRISASKSGNTITVQFGKFGNEELLLNIALLDTEASTVVKRGENAGRTLHHINIVRTFKTITVKDKGETTVEIPKELMNHPLQLIAFVQLKKTFQITGAAQLAF